MTNLRIEVRNNTAGWDLQAWVKNLFDEDYIAAVTALYSVGEYGSFAGDPLSYGMSLRLGFKD